MLTLSKLNTIQNLQQEDKHKEAGRLLFHEIDSLLESHEPAQLEAALTCFLSVATDENREFVYIKGLICAHSGQTQVAIQYLERARFVYAEASQFTLAACSSLALVQLYRDCEAFEIADYYLRCYVEPWLVQLYDTDLLLYAHTHLHQAEIALALGDFDLALKQANVALVSYEQTHNITGKSASLLCLASIFIALAKYQQAQSLLSQTRAYLSSKDFGHELYARLVYLESLYYYYRGQFQQSINVAQDYMRLTDHRCTSKFHAYIHGLLANLYRDLGQFDSAEKWYATARQATYVNAYGQYQFWLDNQVAWLHLLQGNLVQARTYSNASLKTSSYCQIMHFQVTLGITYLLEGKIAVAQRRFTESLHFYEKAGDELAACIARLYVALIAYREARLEAGYTDLEQALRWIAQHHLDYLPYWWHPQLLSEIFIQALALNLYPDVVEQIFCNHLHNTGKATLIELLSSKTSDTAVQAKHLLQMMKSSYIDTVRHLPDGAARQVLMTMLQSGKLLPNTFSSLEKLLCTAERRPKPNPTLLAVFCLYIEGFTREEIAKRLQCSESVVRNYITTIYQSFGIDTEFPTRRARWTRLVEMAKEMSFINSLLLLYILQNYGFFGTF